MKVTIINAFDVRGGAALAAFGLYESLKKYSKLDARLLCGIKESQETNIKPVLSKKARIFDRLFEKIFVEPTVSQSYWLPSSLKLLKNSFLRDADIINIHNLVGTSIPYPSIKRLADKAPLFLSLHDMWYFTGHCSYAFGCPNWQEGCVKCPHPEWSPRLAFDTAGFHWRQKKKVFEYARPILIVGSNWLKDMVDKSPMFVRPEVYHVFDPIDLGIFKPRRKGMAKELLDLPEDVNVVCLGTADISEPRKGYAQFISEISREFILDNKIYLLIMGADSRNLISQIPSYVPYYYLGSVNHSHFRSIVYNASDLFVLPTSADNVPNMLLESMASGVPPLTFDVGGCGEVVRNNSTGFLARAGNYSELLDGINELLCNQTKRNSYSKKCRTYAENNFSQEICAAKYEQIFQRGSLNRELWAQEV